MSINIPLIDNWRIKTDVNNWMLVRVEKDREFIEGYYTTLENLIRGLVNTKIKSFNSTSIHSLLQSIKALENRFIEVIHTLDLGEGGVK